ncbi:hypothetical protein GP486_004340 [Trichoglossum hirsutum]|uniref:Zf-C3HC-domain-containing protein n=1 Tax=Trichoglossum hirsutum TaxID=265104 RepID=A0A9P8LBC5_9PEZI|nr:hypothetical protein GP486_004340 [Trichoglossum hirsutum]
MYATKRKFHNILNSLTSNASTTSLPGVRQSTNASTTTLPADVESRSKKRRVLARPRSEIVSRTDRPQTSHTTSAAATAATESSLESKTIPNYAPWDRNHFLQRLKTFRHVDKWSAKPAAVNEVQWAKRGWSCVGKERVRCVKGCGKEVLVKLEAERSTDDQGDKNEEDDEWKFGVDEEIARRYANMIITEHDESCPWRIRGCDETIHRLSLARPQTSLTALAARYASFVATAGDLPSTLSTPHTPDIQQLTKQVPMEFLLPYLPSPPAERLQPSDKTLNSEAFILALFGWQAETGHIAGLATCEACFRRLGLWLFKANASEDAPMNRLDVIGEHREYCPWVSSLSQSGDGSPRKSLPDIDGQKAGWEILVRVLQGALHLQSRSDYRVAASSLPGGGTNDEAGGDRVAKGRNNEAASLASRDEQDKERWAKLKKLKKVFDVKSRKR